MGGGGALGEEIGGKGVGGVVLQDSSDSEGESGGVDIGLHGVGHVGVVLEGERAAGWIEGVDGEEGAIKEAWVAGAEERPLVVDARSEGGITGRVGADGDGKGSGGERPQDGTGSGHGVVARDGSADEAFDITDQIAEAGLLGFGLDGFGDEGLGLGEGGVGGLHHEVLCQGAGFGIVATVQEAGGEFDEGDFEFATDGDFARAAAGFTGAA